MSKKILPFALLTAGLLILLYSVYKDFGVGRIYSCDLRNRVVGARLIHDGRLPYFYKWKKEDGIRYYDPKNFDDLRISNITASPLFLELLQPLSELPQWRINWWWCGIQYVMLLVMVGIAVSLAETDRGKLTVLVFGFSFLLTEGWRMNIQNGQNYLCIPLLTMMIYFLLVKRKNAWQALLAGTMLVMLVLIRPNALIIFIPFIFLLKNFSRSWLLVFFIPMLLATGWILGDRRERVLWQDYRDGLTEQVKAHQGLHPVIQQNEPSPGFNEWEGIKNEDWRYFNISNPLHLHGETGNFFNLVNMAFHWKIPVKVLAISCLVIILSITGAYYFRNRGNGNFDLAQTALLGYTLYMISDLFSPVFRNTYYFVQFLFPLLLVAGINRPAMKWVHGLLFTGILLNISRIPFITMQHTIGEYLMVAVLIFMVLSNKMIRPCPGKASV